VDVQAQGLWRVSGWCWRRGAGTVSCVGNNGEGEEGEGDREHPGKDGRDRHGGSIKGAKWRGDKGKKPK